VTPLLADSVSIDPLGGLDIAWGWLVAFGLLTIVAACRFLQRQLLRRPLLLELRGWRYRYRDAVARCTGDVPARDIQPVPGRRRRRVRSGGARFGLIAYGKR
jgi:hypothetical protein